MFANAKESDQFGKSESEMNKKIQENAKHCVVNFHHLSIPARKRFGGRVHFPSGAALRIGRRERQRRAKARLPPMGRFAGQTRATVSPAQTLSANTRDGQTTRHTETTLFIRVTTLLLFMEVRLF